MNKYPNAIPVVCTPSRFFSDSTVTVDITTSRLLALKALRQHPECSIQEYSQRYSKVAGQADDPTFALYFKLLDLNVAPECARAALPHSVTTRLFVTGNPRDVAAFCIDCDVDYTDAVFAFQKVPYAPIKLAGKIVLGVQLPVMLHAEMRGPGDAISYCARVSSPDKQLEFGSAGALLRYLRKHMHWSPFEQETIEIELCAHMFTTHQYVRHRSAPIGSMEITEQALPMEWRKAGATNRQGSLEPLDIPPELIAEYMAMKDSIGTAVVWKQRFNLRTLIHTMDLRGPLTTGASGEAVLDDNGRPICDGHAQREAQLLALELRTLVFNPNYGELFKADPEKLYVFAIDDNDRQCTECQELKLSYHNELCGFVNEEPIIFAPIDAGATIAGFGVTDKKRGGSIISRLPSYSSMDEDMRVVPGAAPAIGPICLRLSQLELDAMRGILPVTRPINKA